jgi:hypothetical protein
MSYEVCGLSMKLFLRKASVFLITKRYRYSLLSLLTNFLIDLWIIQIALSLIYSRLWHCLRSINAEKTKRIIVSLNINLTRVRSLSRISIRSFASASDSTRISFRNDHLTQLNKFCLNWELTSCCFRFSTCSFKAILASRNYFVDWFRSMLAVSEFLLMKLVDGVDDFFR